MWDERLAADKSHESEIRLLVSFLKERNMKRLLTVVSLVAFSASAARAAGTPIAVALRAPVAHKSSRAPVAHKASRAPVAHKASRAKPAIPKVVFLKYKVAPADEYFGRLKLSILGIRNTIRDMGYKVDANPEHKMALNAVALTEDAMHDWEAKYPKDSWIPPAILSLERLYAKVDSDEARAHAKFAMVWLVRDYPATAPGKTGKKELADHLVGVKAVPVADVAGGDPGAGSGPASSVK